MDEEIETKRHPLLIFLVVILICAVLVLGYVFYNSFFSKPVYETWEPRAITLENLPTQLESFSAIHELPDDAALELVIDGEHYLVEKGTVRKGSSPTVDFIITLPQSYLSVIGEKGWCTGLQQAKTNGELGIEMKGSSTSLALKYSSLLKYRDCLG